MTILNFKKRYFSKDTSREIMVKVIKEEGFEPTLISNQPNFTYEPHQHQEAKLIVCLQGFMKVTVKEKTYDFEPGDMLKIPGNTLHSGVVGNKGCTYYWSE